MKQLSTRNSYCSMGYQMRALDRDYIEYVMGHTISTYHDIQMKGKEFLRGIYLSSGLSIRPKTCIKKINALKEIIRAVLIQLASRGLFYAFARAAFANT